MGQYNGMTLTTAGLQLEAKAQTGTQLAFTRVALGDGELAAGQSLAALTGLIHWKMDLPITSLAVIGTGTARMTVVLQNAELETGFFAREMGVYATDPDVGEILYAVANAGAVQITAGGIFAYGGPLTIPASVPFIVGDNATKAVTAPAANPIRG